MPAACWSPEHGTLQIGRGQKVENTSYNGGCSRPLPIYVHITYQVRMYGVYKSSIQFLPVKTWTGRLQTPAFLSLGGTGRLTDDRIAALWQVTAGRRNPPLLFDLLAEERAKTAASDLLCALASILCARGAICAHSAVRQATRLAIGEAVHAWRAPCVAPGSRGCSRRRCCPLNLPPHLSMPCLASHGDRNGRLRRRRSCLASSCSWLARCIACVRFRCPRPLFPLPCFLPWMMHGAFRCGASSGASRCTPYPKAPARCSMRLASTRCLASSIASSCLCRIGCWRPHVRWLLPDHMQR